MRRLLVILTGVLALLVSALATTAGVSSPAAAESSDFTKATNRECSSYIIIGNDITLCQVIDYVDYGKGHKPRLCAYLVRYTVRTDNPQYESLTVSHGRRRVTQSRPFWHWYRRTTGDAIRDTHDTCTNQAQRIYGHYALRVDKGIMPDDVHRGTFSVQLPGMS